MQSDEQKSCARTFLGKSGVQYILWQPLLLFMSLSLLLQGCAKLIIRDDDDAAVTTGKVLTRTVLGIATIGFSEAGVAEAKREEEAQRRAEEFVRDWNSQIGRMSYGDALEAFGPPTNTASSNDVMVGTWEEGRITALPAFADKKGNVYGGEYIHHGSKLTLWFDARTKLLTKWDYDVW